MKIFSRILFVLPLMALLLTSCVKEVSFESISMEYVTPKDEILPAEGGEITIKVISTHSFRMSSTSSAFSFFKDGIVNYSKDGVAVVESNHNVHVSPNNTGEARTLYITAQHLTNDEMSASLQFIQPAVAEKE